MADLDAKMKHLEFIQGVIDRMATSSFVFKGWAITVAAGLSAFAATNSRSGLVVIAIASTTLFWIGDSFYLYLERCYRELYNKAAGPKGQELNFSMNIKEYRSFFRWAGSFFSLLLLIFYGLIIVVEIVAVITIHLKSGIH